MAEIEAGMNMFVFRFRSYGDYHFAVIASTLQEAVDAILRHQELTHDSGWTREELTEKGYFDVEIFPPRHVATFAN